MADREPHHAHLAEMRSTIRVAALFQHADGLISAGEYIAIVKRKSSTGDQSYDATAELLRMVRERAARREASRG